MLNIIFSFVALVFLLGLVAYMLVLLANSLRILSISQEKVDLEGELLKAKIKSIMDRREIEAKQLNLSWNGFRKFKVTSKEKETSDITSFYLAPHDGKELPGFLPGQDFAKFGTQRLGHFWIRNARKVFVLKGFSRFEMRENT